MGNNYCSTAEEQIGQCVRNHITSDLRHNPEAKVIELTWLAPGAEIAGIIIEKISYVLGAVWVKLQ